MLNVLTVCQLETSASIAKWFEDANALHASLHYVDLGRQRKQADAHADDSPRRRLFPQDFSRTSTSRILDTRHRFSSSEPFSRVSVMCLSKTSYFSSLSPFASDKPIYPRLLNFSTSQQLSYIRCFFSRKQVGETIIFVNCRYTCTYVTTN